MDNHFLGAILDNPFDLGPRLVWCDFLEEQGQTARAEFVRIQCSLYGKKRARACPKCYGYGRDIGDEECGRCKGKGCIGSLINWLLAKEEERVLDEWVNGREGSNCKWWLGKIGKSSGNVNRACEGFHGGWNGISAEWRGGMVERIRMSLRIFLHIAEELFSKWPVVKVEICDRRPNRDAWNAIGFSWMPMDGKDHPAMEWLGELETGDRWTQESSPWVLPWKIFDLVVGLRTKNVAENDADCMEWLSRACVKYGRELAGLSVLKWPT